MSLPPFNVTPSMTRTTTSGALAISVRPSGPGSTTLIKSIYKVHIAKKLKSLIDLLSNRDYESIRAVMWVCFQTMQVRGHPVEQILLGVRSTGRTLRAVHVRRVPSGSVSEEDLIAANPGVNLFCVSSKDVGYYLTKAYTALTFKALGGGSPQLNTILRSITNILR